MVQAILEMAKISKSKEPTYWLAHKLLARKSLYLETLPNRDSLTYGKKYGLE